VAERDPVLVVGAGPTGLVLALLLAAMGERPRVIDRALGISPFSRAIAIHARTLEIYRQLGIDGAVMEAGLLSPAIALRRGGADIARLDLAQLGDGRTAYPHILFLSQDRHEALLLKALARRGVTVERRTCLEGIRQDGDGVHARWAAPSGPGGGRFAYAVGCDGASSTVRQLLGIPFDGTTSPHRFFVADVESAGPAPASMAMCLGAQGFCGVVPLGAGRARLIGLMPSATDALEEPAFHDVEPHVRGLTGMQADRTHWFSTYRVHHRVARGFRRRRVLLAGDAAHIHSPAGGQGMNTGIADASNLAWKLVHALRHPPQADVVLDTYASERRAEAARVLRTTDRMFSLLAAPAWHGRAWRSAALPALLPVALGWPRLRARAFGLLSQLDVRYGESDYARGGHGAVRAGMRLPWIADTDNHAPLGALAWQLHVYGHADPDLPLLAAPAGLQVHQFPLTPAAREAGLRNGVLYLVRPDGHLGLVTTRLDDLEEFIATRFGTHGR
jgi:2-polyprenyl-6-methoxyphenol hydroxylase-like FAD-dependent oxidoreductase